MGYRIWSILGFMLCCLSLHAQNWNLVWREDFGVAEDTVIKNFPNTSMTVPRHSFAAYESKPHHNNMGVLDYHEQGELIGDCGFIDDGQYGIANNTRWAYQRFASCGGNDQGHFVAGKDHTGNKNGAMMIVNSEVGTGLPIYQQEIEFDLCDSREYKFVIYASSVTTYNEEGGNANLELKVVNSKTGEVVRSIKTGDIPFWQFDGWGDSKGGRADVTAQRKWTEYATEPFTVNNGDRLQLQVTNWGSGYNDFVIDDISLYRNDDVVIIDPTISSNTISSENKASAGSCIFNASFNVPESVLTNWKSVYDNVYFLWQRSKDDGLTWSNELSVSGINKLSAEFEVSSEESEVYRVIITGSASESEAKEQALYIAEHGGPKDGCSYYSISNTLAGVSPTPDCTYKEGLRTLWSDDFGVLSEESSRGADEVKLTLKEGTEGLKNGQYAIISHPESALNIKNSWEQEKELQDASKKAGGAMLYTKLDKSSGDDDADLIYDKTLSGNLCPCKSMSFSFFAFDRNEWAGETLLARVVTEKGDLLGETTLELSHSNSRSWVQCSVPFTLPQNYKQNIHLQILNKTKQNSNVSIAFDNFSLYICGEEAPTGSIQIDNHPGIAYLGGEDCDNATNTLSIQDDSEWKKAYPDYGFAWQKSTDNGKNWLFAGSDRTITHQNSKGDLTEYRIVFAETQESAEQAAQKGIPDDPCILFGFSNRLGIECKTEPCKAPQFELDGEDHYTICDDRTDPVLFQVKQNDEVNIDKMQWYIKGKAEKEWRAIAGENGERLTITDFDIPSCDYLFMAYNDTCLSDSIFFSLDIHKKIELEGEELTVCEGSDVTLKAHVKEKSGEPSEYVWNDMTSTRNEALITNTKRQKVTLSANDGVCFSEEVVYDISVEEIYDPEKVWKGVRDVTRCQDSTETFMIIPSSSEADQQTFFKSHTSQWMEDGEVIGEAFKLDYTFRKNSTLTHIVTGEYCPATSYDFNIIIIPTAELSIQSSQSTICEGDALTLTAKVKNAQSIEWHFISSKGEDQLIDTKEIASLTLQPTQSGSYYLATSKESECGIVYSDTIQVEVREQLDFDISEVPTTLCNGEEIEMIATPTQGEFTLVQWKKNGEKVSDELSFKERPTEKSQYDFEAKSDVCPSFTASLNVDIYQPTILRLTSDQTQVCEGETIILTTENSEVANLQWQSSTDGKEFTTFKEGASQKESFIAGKENEYFFRLSSDNGTCGIDYSDTVKVSVSQTLDYEIAEIPTLLCAGETIELSASEKGGTASQLAWRKNGQVIATTLIHNDTPTENATYTFTASSEACADFSVDFSVEVDNPSQLTLSAEPSLVCEGSTVALTTQMGETKKVKWQVSTDGQNFSDFSEKMEDEQNYTIGKEPQYHFRLASENEGKCKTGYSNIALVEVENIVEITTNQRDFNICEGNELELSFEANLGPNNKIVWQENGQPTSGDESSLTIHPIEESNYEATITGAQCPPVSESFHVSVEKRPTFRLSLSKEAVCAGESVTLSLEADNANGYDWQRKESGEYTTFSSETVSEITFDAKKSATYRITSAATGACEGVTSNEVSLLVESAVSVELPEKATICEGEEIEINATITGEPQSLTWYKKEPLDEAPVEYLKEKSSFVAAPARTTEYTLVFSSENCPSGKSSTLVTVEEIAPMSLTLSEDSICEGAEVTLTATYPETEKIVWEKREKNGFTTIAQGESQLTITPDQTAEYRISATSSAGCQAIPANATLYVFQPSEITVEERSICAGDSVRMTVQGLKEGATPQWFSSDDNFSHPLSTKQALYLKPQTSTDYKVVAVNGKCVNETTTTIKVNTPPIVQSCEEVAIGTYEIVAESNSYPLTYNFGTGATLSNRLENVSYGRRYDITISTEEGCTTLYTLETPLYDIVIPEYFNPGNGNWQVENLNRFPKSSVKIYDRFGKVIATQESDTEGWDGTYNGTPMPSTDYWYLINVPEIRRQFKGHFTLIREK